MRGKPLRFITTDSGCIIPSSHKLNSDGYFRSRDHRHIGSGSKPLIMYHRLVWELSFGTIPDGFEIDHKCRNRACCNLEHLQVLSGKEHTIKTNKERYSERFANAYEHWKQTQCTGVALSKEFGVTFSCACRWIREWKV